MATIRGSVNQSDVNYSKFLGLYEAPDGDTQMKNGVSPKMENFQITESFHLKTRPGIVPYCIMAKGTLGAQCYGYFSDESCEIAIFGGEVYSRSIPGDEWTARGSVQLPISSPGKPPSVRPSIFAFGDAYYILSGKKFYTWTLAGSAFTEVEGYIPLVVSGAAPDGGGTALERINLLTNKRRVQYSADGTSKRFILPETLVKGAADTLILSVSVDGAVVENWTEISIEASGSITKYAAEFSTPPDAGTNNVEIVYRNLSISAGANSRKLIEQMPFCEAFNGATDTRLFVYGVGNILYYSEPTLSGEVTGAYFPALNEIKIGDASSPVTGLQRHYGRMMAFKPDGCYAVAYDTITLPDGTLTAGFYIRAMHRSIGSDAPGQVCVVQNFPRTFCKGSLYDWKQTASYYQDERYARAASEAVQFSMRDAVGKEILLYDDDDRHRFYCFLNDADGTVLVNAYEQGVWFRYTGFYRVWAAGRCGGKLILAMQAGGPNQAGIYGLYELSENHCYDHIPILSDENGGPEISGYTRRPIVCRWESGHMDFGRSNTRKYSSYIWVTLKPGRRVRAWLTARSDRRSGYAEKSAENAVTGLFDETDFADFTFETYEVPRARRMKIKVKKFVYYKLSIRCDGGEETTVPEVPESTDGTLTVLSVDQRVRFTGDAK